MAYVRNWNHYNQSLVHRGSISFWVDEKILDQWHSPIKNGKRGRPEEYPDAIILCALQLRAIYHLPLRAAQGFMQSLMGLFKLSLKVPNYTTLSIRQKKLKVPLYQVCRKEEGLHLLVDSTGLKVYGEGEWKVRQHGHIKKRLWRKFHLAFNSKTQMIEGCELTDLGTQDCEGLTSLLDSIKDPIEVVIGDGAYDRFRCYEDVEKRGAKGIFPPQHNAVTSSERTLSKKKASPEAVAQRDKAIQDIRTLGRAEWKKQVGYHRRSLAETGMFRLKTILGRQVRCRSVENQAVEARIWCSVINKITLQEMQKTSSL